jgi:hypothetical protein
MHPLMPVRGLGDQTQSGDCARSQSVNLAQHGAGGQSGRRSTLGLPGKLYGEHEPQKGAAPGRGGTSDRVVV